MAYYLGRDVHASITTEHEILGIRVSDGDVYADNVLIGAATAVEHGVAGTKSSIITLDVVHGLSDGDPVMFVMDDTTAETASIDPNVTYYAITSGLDTDELALAATKANAIGIEDATCDYNNDPTINYDANTSIVTGMLVTGTGIPNKGFVGTVGGSSNTFELTNDSGALSTTGGNVVNGTLTFRTPVAFANNTQITKANIVRTINGASDDAYASDSTQKTFIMNREYPTFNIDNGEGGLAGIIADNTASNALPLSTTATGLVAARTLNQISDLTGLDIGLNKVDEDLSYFGQRTQLKAEIKQAIEITFTRKKSDMRWAVLAQKARCGIISYTTTGKTAYDVDSAAAYASNLPAAGTVAIQRGDVQDTDTLMHPINQNWGYRLHIQLKATEEVIAIRNACIQDYSVTLSAEGVTEEIITFYSNVDPIFDNAPYALITPEADI